LKEVVVYETVNTPEKIDVSQIYVFTSPSNVEAFLSQNALPGDAVVIAWGKTTEKRMLEQGMRPTFVLETSSLRELEQVLRK
jgi:uroporphyrinogen-III synthase